MHQRNCARLREIVASHGWPRRSVVGEDGADSAWLLLQHFGDIEFQRECLELIRRLPKHERDLKHFAFTEDLVRKVQGRLPRFGTMGLLVDDPANLDALRAEFDLPPLATQEALKTAGKVVLPAGLGRASPGFEWPNITTE